MKNTPRNELGTASFNRFLLVCGTKIKWLYLGATTSWSAVYGLPLVSGALIAILLESVSQARPTASAYWLLGLIVALLVLRSVALWIGLQSTFVLIFRTSAWIKVTILNRMLRRPSSESKIRDKGEVLNRIRDDTDEIGGLLEWTTDLFYRSILVVIAVTTLALTDIVMTIPLALLLLGFWASIALKQRVEKLQAEIRRRQGLIGAEIADLQTGIRDLRLTNVLGVRLQTLEERFTWRRKVQLSHQVYMDLLSDLFRNLVMIGTAVVLITVTVRISDGSFSVGKLALFITYAGWLSKQVYFFGRILARYQSGTVSYSRLAELAPPADGDSAVVGREVGQPLRELAVSGLVCHVSSSHRRPAPVSFTIRPGQLVVITGEIGSGKSTLIRALLGHQEEALGTVTWNGVDVTRDQRWLSSPRVAYARQQSRFLQGTIRENLLLGTELPEERLTEIAELVRLRLGVFGTSRWFGYLARLGHCEPTFWRSTSAFVVGPNAMSPSRSLRR